MTAQSIKELTVTRLNLLILSSYFAIEPKQIRGGIGNRYVGLYGSVVKTFLKESPNSKIFWYAHEDSILRTITSQNIINRKISLFRAVFRVIKATLKSGSNLAIIVAYPYAMPKPNCILEYIY